MMRSRGLVMTGLVLVWAVGCTAGWPPARLDLYLSSPRTGAPPRFSVNELREVPLKVGLWILNDTGSPDSAPKLSDASFAVLTEHVQRQLIRSVPIEVIGMTHAVEPAPLKSRDAPPLQWGKDHGVDYLVVAVLSSTEIEVPERFPWRGSSPGAIGRGLLSGYRAENLALAELALVDVLTGHALIRVEGYAWASLDRLDVPLESNVYPVVRRNLEDPPIYPEKEEDARDVMRAVAGHDAVDQAVMRLKAAWD